MNVLLDLDGLSFVAERRQRRVAEAVGQAGKGALPHGAARALAGRAAAELLPWLSRQLGPLASHGEGFAFRRGSQAGMQSVLHHGE